MKNKIGILMLTLMMILVGTVTVNAADATATLKTDKTQACKGDSFTVTVNVACEEGINGLQAKFSYDENKLELTESTVVDTSKWVNLGENPNLEIIHNSSETAKTADIVKLTFKVKENAELGTAQITVSDIVVDSDAGTDSTKQIGTKEIQVKIVEKTTLPDNNDGNNEQQQPTGSDNNTGNNEQQQTTVKKDDTQAGEKIPYTGTHSVIALIAVIAIFGILAVVKYNKYEI